MNEQFATKLLRTDDEDCAMVNNLTTTELAELLEAKRKLAVLERVCKRLSAICDQYADTLPEPHKSRFVRDVADARKDAA